MYAADTRTAQPASKEWHTTSGGVKGMKSTTEWRLYVLRNFRPSNLMDESITHTSMIVSLLHISDAREASLVFEKYINFFFFDMSFYVQFIFISLDEGQILSCMNLIFEKYIIFFDVCFKVCLKTIFTSLLIKSTEINKIMISVFLLFWNKVSSS